MIGENLYVAICNIRVAILERKYQISQRSPSEGVRQAGYDSWKEDMNILLNEMKEQQKRYEEEKEGNKAQ